MSDEIVSCEHEWAVSPFALFFETKYNGCNYQYIHPTKCCKCGVLKVDKKFAGFGDFDDIEKKLMKQ